MMLAGFWKWNRLNGKWKKLRPATTLGEEEIRLM
jgi:hypothetical protein